MINFKNISFLIIIAFYISCSKDGNTSVTSPDTELQPYYGTYLYKDNDCSGYDIQYLTIDINGISFFDYLGDSCDDTVECYLVESFDITESSIDTVLDFSSENVNISNGTIHIVSDSLILISYDQDDETVEHSWGKIKDKIYIIQSLRPKDYHDRLK